MTREEAIEKVRAAFDAWYSEFYIGDDWSEEFAARDMAIEALSAENKTKCVARIEIDTEEVVKRIKEEYDIVDGWIPCSERLPERDKIVLVSYKTMDTVHMCKYLDDGSKNPWWSYNDDCLAWNNVILAWMPLPKPYKEEGKA